MEWFESWFNTPYYHILYKHRDDTEAKIFLKKLMDHLAPSPKCKILDLACGQGRHSIYLDSLGYKVTGYDLSEASISHALEKSEGNAIFKVQDMREAYEERFDLILNLFTSFGYFENENDHFKAIDEVSKGLTKHGVFVLDFMNVKKILLGLVEEEVQQIEGISFRIKRSIIDDQIVKSISFTHNDSTHEYYEKVKAFSLSDLASLLERTGLQIRELFGDYELNPFDATQSERLILIASKNP